VKLSLGERGKTIREGWRDNRSASDLEKKNYYEGKKKRKEIWGKF